MEKQRPGIRRACEYLDKIKLEQYGTVLPPIRSLAESSGVSFVTMWKALKYLQGNGTLISGPNGNHCFSSNHTPTLSPEKAPCSEFELSEQKNRGRSQQHVTDKLYKDIVTGRFIGSEKLPSCKELQQFYEVSFAKLKKSLAVLVEQQILEQRTNGYFIPSLTGGAGHARIVAIGCGWEDGKIWVDHQDKNYFRAIESECIRMKIQLDVIVHYHNQGRLQFVHSASSKDYDLDDRTILGYIFIVANLDSNPQEVLEKLVRRRRNVAVLDVVGGWKVPQCAQGNRFIQFFTATASTLPAKRVAQYLLGKGHKHIGFFSPFHRALWSQQRFTTISEMFRKAGFPQGAAPFVHNIYAYQWDYLDKNEYQEDLRSLIDQYSQWKKEVHGALFKKFGNIGYNIVKYMTEWNCASGEIYEKMKPLFEKALKDRSITAWVMANDFAATMAIDYLKGCNIKVPDDLSIISFDNTLDAMEYQLTSYDFNNYGIVSLMLRFILAPQTVKPERMGGFLEVDGALVIRRSSG
jgi:DNA-binding LacI/PurR family transcriptional regulator/DNA-binding transcriptional regulator YhcF (GntR family)